MLIGYARVSTSEQNLDLQLDALNKAECEKIFTDKVSGVASHRPEFLKMLETLRTGDVVVVYSLSRLGRGFKDLIHQVESFQKQGIQFKSLTEKIDTTTAEGLLIFRIFCSLAAFERELLIERTNAGVAAARARGRVGGRKAKLNYKEVARLQKLYNDRELSISELCEMFDISRAALYRYLKVSAFLVK